MRWTEQVVCTEEPRNTHRIMVGKAQANIRLERTKHEDNIKICFREICSEDLNNVYFCAGLYTLIGFSDKLRFMVLTLDDIHPCREFPIHGCSECCFSNNGHLFAAVNGNVIHVYSSVSFEKLYNLKGHNGKVNDNKYTSYRNRQLSNTVNGYGQNACSQIPGRHHVQTSSGAHPAPYPMGAISVLTMSQKHNYYIWYGGNPTNKTEIKLV